MPEIDFDIDDLYAWIDTIPLSRPKKNISRDFADGVLLAEVIAFHHPKLVDLHNYPASHSIPQKKNNWETLNRKVLTKIGFKISNDAITSLIEAKPGVIEEILMELRTLLCKRSTSRTCRSRSRPGTPMRTGAVNPADVATVSSNAPKQSPREMHLEGVSDKDYLTYEYGASGYEDSGTDKTKASFPSRPTYLLSKEQPTPEQNRQQQLLNNNAGSSAGKRVAQSKQSGLANASPANESGSIVPDPSASGIPAAVTDESAPQQIIYRGHKMVPLQLLDEKEKEMKTLENTNRSLTLKIFRLETLVNIKDQRVEDLTHQIQNLRSMYERVCEASLMHVRHKASR